jgi:opacity protein-like surface antigen
MKRYFLTILFFASFILLNAQDRQKTIQFSLVGSPHLSWIKSDIKENETGPLYPGYYAGVEFDYFFRDNYGFSTGVNLESKGGSLIYSDKNIIHFDAGADTMKPGTKIKYHLRYLGIPLGLKFTSNEIGYTTIFADVGLDLLFNTRATATATDNNYVKEPVSEEIGLFNIGYHVEGGIQYSFGNNLSLVAGIEFRSTFLDLTNDRGVDKTDNAYINQIGLKLGLAF